MKNYVCVLFGILSTFWVTSLFANGEHLSELMESEWRKKASEFFEYDEPFRTEEIIFNQDGSFKRPAMYTVKEFLPPESYAGIFVLWNYAKHDASKSVDDWDYVGHSMFDRYHPEQNSVLRDGYVYMHAVMANTNQVQVALSVSEPRHGVMFDQSRLAWQPNKDGICHFATEGTTKKEKIIYPKHAPQLSSHFYAFSLSDNIIGSEIQKESGFIRLEPGQAVLVKWFAKEDPQPEYQRLLPKGVLPRHRLCVPEQLVPELYQQCDNGKFDLYFLNVCENTRNAEDHLVFNYFSVSNLAIYLNEDLRVSVGIPGQGMEKIKIRTRGMITREQ